MDLVQFAEYTLYLIAVYKRTVPLIGLSFYCHLNETGLKVPGGYDAS